MAESRKGREIHGRAEEARESGNFLEALKLTDEAILAYQQDDDLLGLAEVLASRQSTFKHLYRQTKDTIFLIFEKYAALLAVDIARKSGEQEALAIPYHNLGKYYLEAEEYEEAADAFRTAIKYLEEYPSERHARPSVIADIQGHQYAAEYFLGDKSALDRALKALSDLEKAEEPSTYNKNAWPSGAHLRIAQMLRKDNPQNAKRHADEAHKIIESDERLILRKEHLQKLLKELS